MFFIGIFGIGEKRKMVGEIVVDRCPRCENNTPMTVYKQYRYFHIFFWPMLRWKERYWVQSGCCASTFLLQKEQGKQVETGERLTLDQDELVPLSGQNPENCPCVGTDFPDEFQHCPYCGRKLTK